MGDDDHDGEYHDEDEEDEETITDIQAANLESTHNEIIGQSRFNEQDFILPSLIDDTPAVESNSRDSDTNRHSSNNNADMLHRTQRRNFDTILEIFRGAAGGFTTYCDFLNSCENDRGNDAEEITIAGVARDLARTNKRCLDEKQYITYEIICCTFLLSQLDETGSQDSIIKQYVTNAMRNQDRQTTPTLSQDQQSSLNTVKKLLKSRGGEDQLRLFLTGPAGAGKTTAIKAAETFCYRFCMHAGIQWTDTSFFYTAYTGSAASAFGGRTIVKASGMWSKGISEEQKNDWRNCRILVIDEISFMKESELIQLDAKLKASRVSRNNRN